MLDYRIIENDTVVVTEKFMRDVAATLLNVKINNNSFKDDEYVNDYKWTCYAIDISKLKDDFIISYDGNYQPFSVFTVENIHPDALKVIDRFDLRHTINKYDVFK